MKLILVCFTFLLTACTSACAKRGAIAEAPAVTPIECFITANTAPLEVSCRGANLGAEVFALDLPSMFEITDTETVKTLSVTNQNWGTKAAPLVLQSCISVSLYDSVTQTTTGHTQCGAMVNTETRALE
jgi:hypothetical protein